MIVGCCPFRYAASILGTEGLQFELQQKQHILIHYKL